MIAVSCLLLLATTVFLLYQWIRKQWRVLEKWNIPHDPPSFRNLGHAAQMMGKNVDEYELRCKMKFGNVWGYYMMTRPRIVVHDPEMIRSIFVKEFSSFPNRFENPDDYGSKGLDDGLLIAEGDQWKRARAALNPTFSKAKLKSMFGIVQMCARNTMQRLQKMEQGEDLTVDISDLFNRLSLDVICSTVFSYDVNSQDDTKPEASISKHAKMFFHATFARKLQIFLKMSFPSLGRFLGSNVPSEEVTYFTKLCRRLIDDRTGVPHDRFDIMESMIRMRNIVNHKGHLQGLTDPEIVANAVSMLLAGYETTGIAMVYLAYNLAFHGHVQCKLQAEIDEAYSKCGDSGIDFFEVNGLEYLDLCIKESLRLYSPISRILRCPSNDVTVNGLKIPRRVMVNAPIGALCRDPNLWDEPMSFKPERMADEQDFNSSIYQPFGVGPRKCLGSKFAMLEIKIAFCTILRKYTFNPTEGTPKPPLELKNFKTTSPAEDIRLCLSPRT